MINNESTQSTAINKDNIPLSVADENNDILQGVYTAQKGYNNQNNAAKLRVLVANFGSTANNALSVATQIVTPAQQVDKIVALVNLPAIADTTPVRDKLSSGNFPIVLSTGALDNENNEDTVFRVAPTVAEEGISAAAYVEKNCPYTKNDVILENCADNDIAVFINAKDAKGAYSTTLGDAFENELQSYNAKLQSDNPRKKFYVVPYDSNSIKDATQLLRSPHDLIFFAGDAIDARILLESLLQKKEYAQTRIIGGDKLYEPYDYQSGKNSEYSHLGFTALAFPDEWIFLQLEEPPPFFCDYATYLGGVSPKGCSAHSGATVIYGYSRPDSHSMLAYDALAVVLSVAKTSGDVLSGKQLLDGIHNIHGANAFTEGVSGRIDFGPDGNPQDKTILMLRVTEDGFTHQEDRHGTF